MLKALQTVAVLWNLQKENGTTLRNTAYKEKDNESRK